MAQRHAGIVLIPHPWRESEAEILPLFLFLHKLKSLFIYIVPFKISESETAALNKQK